MTKLVTSLAVIVVLMAIPTWAAPLLDGTLDAGYYDLRAVQTVETGFGDNINELNAAYAQIEDGTLYLMFTGNLENNLNKLNVFIDSVAGGQNRVGPATDEGGTNPNNDDWAENYSGVGPSAWGYGPGFTFDAGFAADYLIILQNGIDPSDRFGIDYSVIGGGASGFEAASAVFGENALQGANANALPGAGIGVAFNNSNVAGVLAGSGAANQTAATAVLTGIELAIPLSALGNPNPQDILVSAHINGRLHEYLSNQSLPGLPAPQGNLGGDSFGNWNNDVSSINLNNYISDQFFRVLPLPPAPFNIFQWEYVDPLDPSQGKQESTVLTGDGYGLRAEPGLVASNKYLARAYLRAADLTGARFDNSNLTDGDLRQANLMDAVFTFANLTDADFSGAEVRGADLGATNFTPMQLYVTASYLARDLSDIGLQGNDLAGANLSDQNLTGANLTAVNLTGADLNQANLMGAILTYADLANANFNGAEVRGADLSVTNFSAAQLYTTDSYWERDLSGIKLPGSDLTRANLAGQNLTNAHLGSAMLTRANLNEANLTTANLSGANLNGTILSDAILTDAIVTSANLSSTHITLDQLYSTSNYKNHDLSGVQFIGNDLSGVNLAGQVLVATSFYAAKLVGADLTNADLTYAELVNADLSQANLTGANFTNGTVALANLSGANLTNANLSGANFIGTNLTGAKIRGANLSQVRVQVPDPFPNPWNGGFPCGPKHNGAPCSFSTPPTAPTPQTQTFGTGISLAQLVSTASYGDHDLSNATLANNNFNGGNFAGFNLTNMNVSGTTLIEADLSGADARGTTTTGVNLTGAVVTNLIQPDGRVDGLDLMAGQVLTVRDYDGNSSGTIPITVDQHFAMGAGGTLRMVFDTDAWDSPISFAAGIPVMLGGSLELAFAADVSLTSQIGRTFDLFDWSGVLPTGTFSVGGSYVWDLSSLYTTGEVTFLANSGLAGDFNDDGAVNAADFTLWRDGVGTTYGQNSYGVWKNHFGVSFGTGSGETLHSSVPEPTAFYLLGVGLVTAWIMRRARPTCAFPRPFVSACLCLSILALVILQCIQARADLPEIQLAKIGAPIWKPVDFQLFSAPATPFDQEFGHVYNTLLPFDTPLATSYTPHAPPYNTELSSGALAGGYTSQSVFTSDAITLDPNGIYFAFMLVPDPGITGSSRDFASGPVIPNSIFPIASNIDVWLDGVLVDRTPGADGIISVQPRDVAFQGTSHLESLLAIWHPWDNDLTVGPLGNYDLRLSIRDAGGSGWDVVAPFQVVPELVGDYDGNEMVGPEDYDVWRSTFGSTTDLAADGNGSQSINAADFVLWRDRLGASIGLSAGLANSPTAAGTVPEPSSVVLLLLATATLLYCCRRICDSVQFIVWHGPS